MTLNTIEGGAKHEFRAHRLMLGYPPNVRMVLDGRAIAAMILSRPSVPIGAAVEFMAEESPGSIGQSAG